MPVEFNAILQQYERKGEKTSQLYIEVPKRTVREALNHWKKTSVRVKGHLDYFKFVQTPLKPVGDGNYILLLTGDMKKGINKGAGDTVRVRLTKDTKMFPVDIEFYTALREYPEATSFYFRLSDVQKNYYHKWIFDAKTKEKTAERITETILALMKKQKYAEMVKERNTFSKPFNIITGGMFLFCLGG